MSAPPAVTALAADRLPFTLCLRGGSHQHGLAVPTSDEDWLGIVHDPTDDRRLFSAHPDSVHSADGNVKLYTLRKFALMLSKGDVNCTELTAQADHVQVLPAPHERTPEQAYVSAFLTAMRPHLVTDRLLGAYQGLMNGALKEYAAHPNTKTLASAYRLATCGLHLMDTRTVPHFARLPERDVASLIRAGTLPPEQAERLTASVTQVFTDRYRRGDAGLPSTDALRAAVDTFFTTDAP